MLASTNPFYTVGHSRRTVDELVALLRAGGVEQIVDVRAMPRSRVNPQFNRDTLADTLAPLGIAYTHSPALAGLRSRSRTVNDEVNGYWQNHSFQNYADYALSESFRQGLASLIENGRQRPCVIMCAEAVWWRCHRRIIADHLIHYGETVYHLMGEGRIEPAQMTVAARRRADGALIYPAQEA
ncbi:DUF488 family protein [Salinisphaera sp. LB1]|uniref:DUF488 domain-containing protein n=1 Tax=Salinisphaera sp. LB1 TaxID=2183911 RepID=UPI000D70506C|nr:DUF488 domain-containing protein [Salinisphaera sp. LB1]AWN17914.1 protein of unknown function DUF1130 [Salinisphaera sp. LB1]